MKKGMGFLLAGLVAGAAVAIGGTANSTELHFKYYYNNAPDQLTYFSDWNQSSAPAPISFNFQSTEILVTGGHDLILLAGNYDSSAFFGEVTFGNAAGGGGFTDTALVSDNGPQVYTGPESAPIFSPGKYVMSDGGVLTVTTTVPEPATWTLMIAGFGGLGFLGYRRNKAAAFAA